MSDRAAELSMHIARMAMNILAAPIVYLTLVNGKQYTSSFGNNRTTFHKYGRRG